ncbi:MAG: polyprenyl synthetase family protein [Candidatus Micrarchaeota archaeon]
MKLKNFHSRKKLVEAELERIIPKSKKPPQVYGLIHEFLSRGGKRFRPLLCLACSRMVGGKDSDSLTAAAAIELFHNFTLIHDDIEDSSEMRRAKPCLHISHGIPLALNAGDGLFMMVWKAALEINSPRSLQAQKILLSSFTSVLEGQALELSWHHNNNWNITKDDYMQMVGGKTASLISASCNVGALLGGGTPEQCSSLATYGYKIGLAFQVQDDLLNLIGEEKKYKKEIGGDIREGKRTLMVLDCIPKLSPSDAKKMKKILSAPKNSPSQINWCIEKMRSTNSLKYGEEYAKTLVEEAISELKIFDENEERKELEAVAKYIITRED